tara:strand:- start:1897 stop:2127 length:231 start_codon:yes stop_codon:yes gene_type:complete
MFKWIKGLGKKPEGVTRCRKCNVKLLSLLGYWMHPENGCPIQDGLFVEIEVLDEFLQNKLKKMYGEPDKEDFFDEN